jgi:hypothetical protein
MPFDIEPPESIFLAEHSLDWSPGPDSPLLEAFRDFKSSAPDIYRCNEYRWEV